jgi:predicted ATPase
VERLVAHGLLEPGEADGQVAFRHAMVRDAAYASVPLGERHIKHARLAEWLVRRHDEAPGDSEADAARIALHFERAVTLQRELAGAEGSPPDPALRAQAARYLVISARDANLHDEPREAERWYERIADLELLDGDEALQVSLDHASTLVSLRRIDEAEAVLRSVVERAPGLTAMAGDAFTGLGVVARLQGDAEAARDWFDAARHAWQG